MWDRLNTESNKELMEAGYRFVCFFVPESDHVAMKLVTFEAWDYAVQLSKTQKHTTDKPWKNSDIEPEAYKLVLNEEELFQKALCEKLDAWQGISVGLSAKAKLCRYVRFLLWKTMDRPPSYRAVALGTLLYRYSTKQVHDFTDYRLTGDFSSIRRTLLKWIEKPFGKDMRKEVINGGREVKQEEITLIVETLRWFVSGPVMAVMANKSTQPVHPNMPNGKLDLLNPGTGNHLHVLACPDCGGIPELVNQWNKKCDKKEMR